MRKENEKIKELNVSHLSILESQCVNKEALQLQLCHIEKVMDVVEKKNAESIEKIVKEKRRNNKSKEIE